MKKCIVIPFGIMLMIVFACNKDENPTPTCEDGIMNGNETGIDCGGDCGECFICTSTYCSLLSGATTNEARTSISWIGVDYNWKFTFYSDGRFDEIEHGDLARGQWEFNNPDSPLRIKAKYSQPLEIQGLVLNYEINKLVSDTLILDNGERLVTFLKE